MILCDKLSEENIICNFLLSNGEESVMVYWDGDDFSTIGEVPEFYAIFDNDENIMKNFRELLEKGVFECDSYKMELV